MVVQREEGELVTVPIEDLGMLLVSEPRVTLSHCLLIALLKNNVAVIFCDEKHMPSGVALPFSGASAQSQTMDIQIAATEPVKKRVWQRLIQAKIKGQARVLAKTGAENGAMLQWAKAVRSGDPDNLEARAARFYWPRLFGNDFTREREGPPPNMLLNYGYAVLRASIARALVGAGLHPAISVHHKNKYNDYRLADDVMEPLRPLVDMRVYTVWKENPSISEMTKEIKQALLEIQGAILVFDGQNETFYAALTHFAASLRRALSGDGDIVIPQW